MNARAAMHIYAPYLHIYESSVFTLHLNILFYFSDSHLNKTNGPPADEVTESSAKQMANGLSPSQAR